MSILNKARKWSSEDSIPLNLSILLFNSRLTSFLSPKHPLPSYLNLFSLFQGSIAYSNIYLPRSLSYTITSVLSLLIFIPLSVNTHLTCLQIFVRTLMSLQLRQGLPHFQRFHHPTLLHQFTTKIHKESVKNWREHSTPFHSYCYSELVTFSHLRFTLHRLYIFTL